MLLHSRAAAAKAKKQSVRIREMPLALQIITIHHDDPEAPDIGHKAGLMPDVTSVVLQG